MAQRVRFALGVLLALMVCLSPFAFGGSSARATPLPCSAAKELLLLGRLNAAEAAYLEALKTDGGLACGSAGLKQLAAKDDAKSSKPSKQRDGDCKKADALAEAGQKEKAEASYAKTLEAAPHSRCASEGLEGLKDMQDLAEQLGNLAKIVTSALVLLGVAVVVALLILSGLISLLTWPARPRRSRFIRPLVRCGLEVSAMEDTWMASRMGPQVTSLIREQITPRRRGPSMGAGYADLHDKLKPLADVSPEAKVIVSLASSLAAVRRQERFEVRGALQPPSSKGPGLSIELICEKRHFASTTLWGSEFGAPADETEAFQRLAAPAAGWVEHQIAKKLKTDDEMLSRDPHSWALFRAGFSWHSIDSAKAAELYELALNRDPENVGALINLSVIEMDAANYPDTEELMEAALGLLSGDPP